jgi:hypothetical protein
MILALDEGELSASALWPFASGERAPKELGGLHRRLDPVEKGGNLLLPGIKQLPSSQ